MPNAISGNTIKLREVPKAVSTNCAPKDGKNSGNDLQVMDAGRILMGGADYAGPG